MELHCRLNDIILNSGLSVDYNEIGKQAKLSEKCPDTDSFEISFEALNEEFKLELICERQDAKKSRTLSRWETYLPTYLLESIFCARWSRGSFPFRYSDGTLAEMTVRW